MTRESPPKNVTRQHRNCFAVAILTCLVLLLGARLHAQEWDADKTVPYQHAVRLKEALDQVGVQNALVTIASGKHGSFQSEKQRMAYSAIENFLTQIGLLSGKSRYGCAVKNK